MHGLLLIDKPSGMTSHDVVQKVRRIYRTRKVGHAGTLDPMATGVLPVAIGDGTKILQFLLSENKSYRATLKLGETTDTLDSEGRILQVRPVPNTTPAELTDICADFCGEIEQIPPMFSALKQDGVPLYKLARQGQTVERKPRRVKIDRLVILEIDARQLTIEVDCSKGTYIRSLVYDIGERLGCGAHVTTLRRLSCGDFMLEDCRTLEALQELEEPSTVLLPLDQALRAYPTVQLAEPAANAIKFGIPPETSQTETARELENGELVRLQINHELAGIARYAPHREKEKRGDFELIRVFVSH